MDKYLISYVYSGYNDPHNSFNYSIVNSIEAFIDEVEAYDDGKYIVLNILPITPEQYEKWDGALNGM